MEIHFYAKKMFQVYDCVCVCIYLPLKWHNHTNTYKHKHNYDSSFIFERNCERMLERTGNESNECLN